MMMVVLSDFQDCKRSLSPCYSSRRRARFKLFSCFSKKIFCDGVATFFVDKTGSDDP